MCRSILLHYFHGVVSATSSICTISFHWISVQSFWALPIISWMLKSLLWIEKFFKQFVGIWNLFLLNSFICFFFKLSYFVSSFPLKFPYFFRRFSLFHPFHSMPHAFPFFLSFFLSFLCLNIGLRHRLSQWWLSRLWWILHGNKFKLTEEFKQNNSI